MSGVRIPPLLAAAMALAGGIRQEGNRKRQLREHEEQRAAEREDREAARAERELRRSAFERQQQDDDTRAQLDILGNPNLRRPDTSALDVTDPFGGRAPVLAAGVRRLRADPNPGETDSMSAPPSPMIGDVYAPTLSTAQRLLANRPEGGADTRPRVKTRFGEMIYERPTPKAYNPETDPDVVKDLYLAEHKPREPKAPVMGSPEWLAAKQKELELEARFRAPRADQDPSWQTVQTADGYVQVNPKTGETRPLAGLKPPPRARNQASLAAEGFARRMESAEAEFNTKNDKGETLAERGRPRLAASAAGALPLVGGFAERTFSTSAQQSFRTLAEDWIRAKLRKESGAAIGGKESDDEYRTYFPQPGDSKEVIQLKARRRAIAIENMKREAGAQMYSPDNPFAGQE